MRSAVVLALLVTVLVAPPAGAAGTSAPTTVDDVTLRWGVSQEAGNAAWAPRTYNHFSAGRIPDPGRGGQTLAQRDWRQRAGDVELEKWDGRAWRDATWAGLSTDAAGAPLTTPTAGRFSGHQVVMHGGTGTVDPASGTARVTWDGEVTVLLYSGMSFFYLADPVLEVAEGKGTLSGTLSGFASSQSDTSVWEQVPPRQAVLADLPDVDLTASGFTAQPAYDDVRVSGVDQRLGGEHEGSFPQSWVDFTDRIGTAAYWHSSGSATDPWKRALPVTVAVGGGAPPAPAPSQAPTVPQVDNSAPPAPTPTSSAPSASATSSSAPAVTAPGSVLPPGSAAAPLVATTTPTPSAAAVLGSSLTAAAPGEPTRLVAAGPADATSPARAWWLAGSALLAAAALLLAGPPLLRRLRRRTPRVR